MCSINDIYIQAEKIDIYLLEIWKDIIKKMRRMHINDDNGKVELE